MALHGVAAGFPGGEPQPGGAPEDFTPADAYTAVRRVPERRAEFAAGDHGTKEGLDG
jgi:hypothetical protein